MSEKLRLDRIIGFQNTFHTKYINIIIIIDCIGPSIILRKLFQGVLSFFGSGLASSVHPKKYQEFQAPKKIFEILATPKNTTIMYLDIKKIP